MAIFKNFIKKIVLCCLKISHYSKNIISIGKNFLSTYSSLHLFFFWRVLIAFEIIVIFQKKTKIIKNIQTELCEEMKIEPFNFLVVFEKDLKRRH